MGDPCLNRLLTAHMETGEVWVPSGLVMPPESGGAVLCVQGGGIFLRLWPLMWLDLRRPHKESAPDWGPVGERHAHSQDDHGLWPESGQQSSAAIHSPARFRADERCVSASPQIEQHPERMLVPEAGSRLCARLQQTKGSWQVSKSPKR